MVIIGARRICHEPTTTRCPWAIVPDAGHFAFIAALLVGLIPVARRALAGATAGTPFSIETLMTIAATGAVIIGATEEAAIVILLFLVGELLEPGEGRRDDEVPAGLDKVLHGVEAVWLGRGGGRRVEGKQGAE